ncbi:MAG: hypothetical protein EA356_00550 [Geminicoccaceae bacterium]|nr:MAG: hypothetical protein EA356_00550 [Geminicoccaceae bacterium]
MRRRRGHGWFVDPTPLSSEEFALDAHGRLMAIQGSAAYVRMDLLSVVLHEPGHVMGLEHEDATHHGDVMSHVLDVGQRRSVQGFTDIVVAEPAPPPSSGNGRGNGNGQGGRTQAFDDASGTLVDWTRLTFWRWTR